MTTLRTTLATRCWLSSSSQRWRRSPRLALPPEIRLEAAARTACDAAAAAGRPVRPAGTSVRRPPSPPGLRAHRVTSTAHPGISTAGRQRDARSRRTAARRAVSTAVPAVSQHGRRAPACRSLARAQPPTPRSAACALGFGAVVAARLPRRRVLRRTPGDGPGSPSRAFAGIQLLLGRGVTPGRLELLSLSALAGLMALTLLSALWGIAGTEAIREAERCALYVVGLAALLVVAQPATIRALLNGVLGGAVVLAAFGIVDRAASAPTLGSVSGLASQGARRLCERPRIADGTRRRAGARTPGRHPRHPAGSAHSSRGDMCGRAPADLEPRSVAVRVGRPRGPRRHAVPSPAGSSLRSRAPGSFSCSSRCLASRSETGRRTGASRSRMRRNTSCWDPAPAASTTTGSSTGPFRYTCATPTTSTSRPSRSSASSGSRSCCRRPRHSARRRGSARDRRLVATAAAAYVGLPRPRRARLGLGDARHDVCRPRLRCRVARRRPHALSRSTLESTVLAPGRRWSEHRHAAVLDPQGAMSFEKIELTRFLDRPRASDELMLSEQRST